MNKIPDGGGSGRLKPPFKTIGGNMETIKQIWKDHRKIVIGAGVVVVILIIAAL